MGEKLRQITDTIHQTVYLSELESSMMSTAYFYRLHDVYQNSTVYLTYPSNRTKRYEHSYGTMEIAGQMFFSATTNTEKANKAIIAELLEKAEDYLKIIVTELLSGKEQTYCSHSHSDLGGCFPVVKNHREIEKESENVLNTTFRFMSYVSDTALNHYIPPFSDATNKQKFLYQCLLEAVRIVALFHDIGHPPYSHIMEKVLDELYVKYENNANNGLKEEFIDSLKPYKGKDTDEITCLLSPPLKGSAHLHEQVGLKMLVGAFEDVFASVFRSNAIKNVNPKKKTTLAVYYTTVAEFCFAILRNQDSFFTSFHRIVDGVVDADRMDYVVRDSLNSGVDWGTIPYKRIIESCSFIKHIYEGKDYYLIAFPQKTAEDINDLLITRFKIFSRINYHHRSYKTALILQRLVKALAEDYLSKDGLNDRVLCPGISDLWNCLTSTLNSRDLYIIQWNDSTLISHLYQTLVEVKKHSNEDYGLTIDEFDNVSNMLEEFLLNRKHFYSVFKRQSDFSPVLSEVLNHLSPILDKIKAYETAKFVVSESEALDKAADSLTRLNPEQIQYIIRLGDADALFRVLPLDLSAIILNVLETYKNNGSIQAFLFDENKKRLRTGLPECKDGSDGIYLYNAYSDEPILYDVSNLEQQIILLQNYTLQYIAYIIPPDEEKVDALITSVRDDIRAQILAKTEECLKKIFPNCLRE